MSAISQFRGYLLLSLFLLTYSLMANQNYIQFEHLTIEDGLSENRVTCIYKDSKDYMWFGTYDGLNRYDGYKIIIYREDPKDLTSIAGNNVSCIFEDSQNILWIGTRDGGLNAYNYEKDNFIHYRHDPQNINSIGSNGVYAIFEDCRKNLWFGNNNGGLNLFDRNRNRFIQYRNDGSDNCLKNENVYWIYEDSEDNLWIGTNGGGIHRYDPHTNSFVFYRYAEDNIKNLRTSYFGKRIFEDSQGNLWIGSEGEGLYLFDRTSQTFKHIDQIIGKNKLSQSVISSFYEDENGILWIGTDGGGINLLNLKTRTVSYLKYNPDNPFGISNNQIYTIYQDDKDILWIGNYNGGVNIYNKNKYKFLHIRQKKDISGLSFKSVLAIYEDSQGRLWIGTDGGGLNLYNRKTKLFRYFFHDKDNPYSLSGDVIKSIYEDKRGNLWFGTYANGFNLFDEQTNRFIHFRNEPGKSNCISSNHIWIIFEDQNNNLWFGTLGGGLDLYDRDTGIFINYQNDNADSSSISSNNIMTIFEDSKGQMWVGTEGGGLNLFHRETGTFIRYLHDSNDNSSLSNNDVKVIFEDSDKQLWIGTSAGLNRFDPATESFHVHFKKNGLPSNAIKGILEDDYKNLWISTNYGLSKFNKQTGTFRNYDIHDGLQSYGFNNGAFFKGSDGMMYFGGLNGLNSFHPDSIIDNRDIPRVVITDFLIFNKSVKIDAVNSPLKKNISLTDQLSLSYKQNVFSFEYTALNFWSPGKNQFAYKMEGFDANWNFTNAKRRLATYTNLNPGDYIFRVQASNNDGVWNREGTVIKIIITPPYWQTWWFKMISGLSVLAAIFAIYKRRVKSIQEQNKKLEQKVIARTTELKSYIHELKNFTKLASHDLREPLRMVTMFLQLLAKQYKTCIDDRAKEYISFATENALRMKKLIDNLMQYYAIMQNNHPLITIQCSSILDNIIDQSHRENEKSNAKITYDDPLPMLTGDWMKLTILFKNLIDNAIQFNDKKKPEVHISSQMRNKEYIISVKDNGIGIDPQFQNKIFSVFQRLHLHDEYSGTGIGLAMCKKIVEQYGGKIWVESQEGKGSTFYFTMPFGPN